MERDQPLTPAGRLFLQPQLDQVINAAVTVEFPLDVDAIKAAVKESVIPKHPRFCSLLVRNSRGREYWRRTAVDIDNHIIVHHPPLPEDPSVSDEDAVNDFMADLTVSSPLPTDKPLWEIHLLMAHRTMLFRFHHALGDGISLMSMTMSCCRRVDDPTKLPTIAGVGAAAPRRWSLWTLLMVVWYTLVYVLEFTLRTLWVRDKASSVRGGAGVELWPRKMATARFRLDDMKRVKQAIADATLNDVLFGVISCGLSRYLDIMESPKALVEGQQITGLAMVNLRSQSGLQAITMHMVSYAGVADLQILVAKEIIPDPKLLATCFEDALLQMKEAAAPLNLKETV